MSFESISSEIPLAFNSTKYFLYTLARPDPSNSFSLVTVLEERTGLSAYWNNITKEIG